MKTKQLIKLLQEADPSGELHIRMRDGGMPYFVDILPGYYDGGYWYIDDKGKMIYTTIGNKVEIFSRDYGDVVEDYDGDMKKIRKHIGIDISNKIFHKKQTKEFWEKIEREAKEHIALMKEIDEKISSSK